MMVVVGIVPTSGMGSPDTLPSSRGTPPSAGAAGYMDAYRQADEEHPGAVAHPRRDGLRAHRARGATSHDTLYRTEEQRFPTVDPPIAPGATPDVAAAGTCRVRLVGDSLLVGMADALAAGLASACAVTALDGREGRTIAEGTQRLVAAPLGDETALVVVLGTNDLATGATGPARRAHRGAAGRGRRPGRDLETSAAQGLATGSEVLASALGAARRAHPRLVVADWVGYLGSLPDAEGYRAGDGVHYTPDGYRVMADWLVRQLAAPRCWPSTRPWATEGSARCCSTPRCSPVCRSRPRAGRRALGGPAGRADGPHRRPDPHPGRRRRPRLRFAEEFLPESEEFWHEVVAAAPVVAGDSACLQPDPTMPVPQIIEVVWRCEMLKTPPRLWTPDGVVEGAEAQDLLLGEAHAVAAWSDRGAAPCDETAPYTGVFPLPALALATRCDPVQNVRTAARLVLDQESRPLDQRPGATEWERAAAGWATMAPALGDPSVNHFVAEGRRAAGFTPVVRGGPRRHPRRRGGRRSAWGSLAPMARFDPRRSTSTPPAGTRPSPPPRSTRCSRPAPPAIRDPTGRRVRVAGRPAGRPPARGRPARSGLAGAAAYARWVGARGAFPVAGQTGLVPGCTTRLVPPHIDRPPVTGTATPVNPGSSPTGSSPRPRCTPATPPRSRWT